MCGLLVSLPIAADSSVRADNDFEALKEGQNTGAFRVETVYEDEAGHAMGARFRHAQTGFVLDVLRIQSVPQSFMWVNSFPPSDQGEPHTCEHLLLGKGTRGRYVASLEDMSLGQSSAFTMQLQTCYHFHTAAGADVFFQLMKAKLDALLHPNFSDEEIRREVCNVGYAFDAADSSLRLEEKGTVYNEMVSSYERPWANLGHELDRMLYGQGHPLCNDAGGYPDAIRTMTPSDLRTFHAESYRLGNMGMVVTVPDEITLADCLERTGTVLKKVQPEPELGADPATAEDRLPPPVSAPEGTIKITSYPHQNEKEPGLLLMAWPPALELNNREMYVLELLVGNLAGGETSNLYRKFIDSKTRVMDVGANAVFGWVSSDLGHPVYVGLNNIKRETAEEAVMDSVRRIVQGELAAVAGYADGSDELKQFNERAANRVKERRRDLRKFLNSPPGFGFRGTGAEWYGHLKRLQKAEGFRKRLTLDDELQFAETLLKSGKNFWKDYIEQWRLVSAKPYAVAAKAGPEMLRQSEAARENRVRDFVSGLQARYGVSAGQAAMAKYKEEYDRQTAEIDLEAKKIPMPGFVEKPPLSLDEQLRYREERIDGAVPVVKSTFESMTGATVGMAFRMEVAPSSLLVYVPALPTLLTEVGVVKDGQPIAYDEMKEGIRREILYLVAYYTVNHRTERVELVLKGSGSDSEESRKAIEWMDAVLFHANWGEENLERIRDAVDLQLKQLRNTMRYAEEAWVDEPSNAYWKQTNPLLMSADCFLTKEYALHRLRWMLKDAATDAEAAEFGDFMHRLAFLGSSQERAGLAANLEEMTAGKPGDAASLVAELPEGVQKLAREAAGDLTQLLADIPDASLASDWQQLCEQIAVDLKSPAAKALSDLQSIMSLLRKKDNVRLFTVAGSEAGAKLEPEVKRIVAKLDGAPSQRHDHHTKPAVIARLQEREPGLSQPLYVGLMNENTRSGVFLNTADCASYEDADPNKLLKFLSARLYGGGGAHSMFMKTWGAGLAYSNGLRSNENTGRMIYYAERCPDLAQTMDFVVNELRHAPYDTSLANYAIAQAFSVSRGASSYEERGEAMAADLADGLTPDKVKRFRQGILALRDSRDLYAQLHERMEATYGEVLPGYGPKASEVPSAVNFIIGPEKQFQSYEEYLHGVEGDVKLHRLYPRDFWLTPE